MKRLKLAKKTIEISSIVICFCFYNVIIEWLEKSGLISSPSLTILVCIFFITLIYLGVQFILELVIEIPGLRKKILGQDYIEGQWIEYFYKREIIDHKEVERKVGYSIVTIKRDDEALTIKGRNYNYADSKHLGDFSSESLKYLGQDLHYSYKYHDNIADPETKGVAIMSFTSSGDSEPIEYTGFFINFDGERKTNFMGWKVIEKDVENKISDSQPRLNRHRFILHFIKEMTEIE